MPVRSLTLHARALERWLSEESLPPNANGR